MINEKIQTGDKVSVAVVRGDPKAWWQSAVDKSMQVNAVLTAHESTFQPMIHADVTIDLLIEEQTGAMSMVDEDEFCRILGRTLITKIEEKL